MEMRWKVGSGLPGVDEEAASLQPELCPVWEKYYLFYLIITIKLVGIFVTIKKIFVLLFSMVLTSVFTLAGKNVSSR